MTTTNNITVHAIAPSELDGILTAEEIAKINEKMALAAHKIANMHAFRESDITLYYEPEDKHLHMQVNFGGFNAKELSVIAEALDGK